MKRKFKRLIFLLLAFTMVISSFGLSACDDKVASDPVLEDTKGGPYYSLQEAYNFGYIRGDNLKNVAYYYNKEQNKNYTIPNFTPSTKIPNIIDDNTKEFIKRYYLIKVRELQEGSEEYNKAYNHVNLGKYYGCYDGYYVLDVNNSYDYIDIYVFEKYNIGGMEFYNYSPNVTWVVKIK